MGVKWLGSMGYRKMRLRSGFSAHCSYSNVGVSTHLVSIKSIERTPKPILAPYLIKFLARVATLSGAARA